MHIIRSMFLSFILSSLFMFDKEKMQFTATDLAHKNQGMLCVWILFSFLMMKPELVKICFCLLSSELFDLSESDVESRGCCSEWRKPSGTRSLPF